MAITLRHLCKYANEKYKMVQLAGEGNMNALVDWVHLLEDPEVAGFLHGNELVFTTGIGNKASDWYLEYVKDLIGNGVSGLVLNIGPYIEKVPEDVLEYCRAIDFPLFTIPWDTRIVDVTNDFCHRIIRAEETETSLANAFKNAIFFPNNVTGYKSALERKGFDLDADFMVALIKMQAPNQKSFDDFAKNIRMHLAKILFAYSDRFSFFRQDNYYIVVLQNFTTEAIDQAIVRLDEVCHYGNKKTKIHAGYSGIEKGISSLPRSYKRAQEVQKMAEKKRQLKLSYDDLGIHQILIEVEDSQVLNRYYQNTLGILEDYDDKHQSDYFYILRVYLENNNSVEKVANETYVHRNTINYKIKKIKEILDMELNNKQVVELLLAYKIKELM